MAFDIQGALQSGYSPEEISQHLKFDYKGALASGYSDEEVLSHLSGLENSSEDTVARKLGRSVVGAVGAAADFLAPANLAVPGLIEGARTAIPNALGGISSSQAAENITSGSIPGTSIPYSELAPSKLLENFTGAGSIRNKEYEQANRPIHALTEAATDLGGWSAEKTGSPLIGTVTNVGAGLLAMGGAHKLATKATQMAQRPVVSDPKLNAAKAEFDARKGKETQDWKQGVDPETGLPYKDIVNPDDVMMRHPQDLQAPQYGLGGKVAMPEDSAGLSRPAFEPGERAVQSTYDLGEQQAGKQPVPEAYQKLREDLGWDKPKESIGVDVDTSNVSNPFFKGDQKVNVEKDSISGQPIFPEDAISTEKRIFSEGPEGEVAGAYVKGINGYYLNTKYISELWQRLSDNTKKKLGLKTAEDFQDFVEMHERTHWNDYKQTGDILKPGESVIESEKRVNNWVKEQRDPLMADDSVGPARFPENFREPYDGPPRQVPSKQRSGAQLRAEKEQLERTLESVNKKLSELELQDFGVADISKLDAYKKVLESRISQMQDAIARGRTMGFSFEPKTPSKGTSRKSKVSTEDVPDRLNEVFKDEADQAYQQLRNEGKTDAQAKAEVAVKYPEAGVGGKQGGAINFGIQEAVQKVVDNLKGISITEFAKTLGSSVEDPLVRELYNKYYGKDVKEGLTPEQLALRKIPGLPEVISPELKPIEDMIPRWEVETDVSSSGKSLRENLSSGGRMVAMRTGNSLIDWNVENILGSTKAAQVIIKEAQHEIKGEVKKLTGNLFNRFSDGTGERTFVYAMGELLRVEGKQDLSRVPSEAQALVRTIRKNLDSLGVKIQDELISQGVTNFKWRPNYLAGVFFGPYRSIVKDAAGTTIGVIAGRTKAEAVAAVDHVKQTMPDVTFDVPEYNPKFDKGASSLGARYGKASEVLELLRNQDEAAQQLQTTLSDYYSKVQENYMGYKQHFKKKSGVFGSEGGRPWESAKDNAYDLLEAQLGILDHGYNWLAEQKISKDMDKILTNSEIGKNQKNAVNYVNMYLDHAFGRMKDELAAVDTGIVKASEMLGISPAASKEILAITRNMALTGTLGLSGAFGLTQFVQVPTTLAIAFSKALDKGISGNKSGSTLVGTWDLIQGLNGKVENMTKEGRYFYDYFKKAGELDAVLTEHTIHRKIIGTTGMNPIQSAIASTVNVGFKGGELMSHLIGKVSIEKPEAWTRGTFAMSMAHFYKSAGYSMQEAAILAKKDASALFVDYTSQERAMIFQRMGEAGKFASTVSTFKLNNLNQWFTFGNKKMYGALAALAVTSWMTTGLSGMPFMDEAEFLSTWAKGKGINLDTPKEYMLKNLPDAVSFGPLSQVPKAFGGPTMAIGPKFSQSNVIPDDMASFLYPLLSFYTNKASKGADWVKSGNFAGQEGKAFLREMAPGNLKYLVDSKALTNEKGLTLDTNTMHDKTPTYFERSKGDRILGVLMGIPSLNEWKSKQIKYLDKINEQAWKESTKSKVANTVSAFDNQDKPRFEKLFKEAVTYSPESASEITEYIKGHAQARNMNLDQYLRLHFAKKATTVHGASLLQSFKKTEGNR
jgi:hypothetical protein